MEKTKCSGSVLSRSWEIGFRLFPPRQDEDFDPEGEEADDGSAGKIEPIELREVSEGPVKTAFQRPKEPD